MIIRKKVIAVLIAMLLLFSLSMMPIDATNEVSRAEIKSVKNTSVQSQNISWKKVAGAQGYQLYYKINNGRFKRAVTTSKRT